MEVVEDSAAAGPVVVGGDSDYSDTGCHGVSGKYWGHFSLRLEVN